MTIKSVWEPNDALVIGPPAEGHPGSSVNNDDDGDDDNDNSDDGDDDDGDDDDGDDERK